MAIRVLVWNEHVSERREAAAARAYPNGLHAAVAEGIKGLLGDSADVTTATGDRLSHNPASGPVARPEEPLYPARAVERGMR